MARRRLAKRGISRRRLRRSTVPLLPTLLTLAKGVCGLGSITLATSSPPDGGEGKLVFFESEQDVKGKLAYVRINWTGPYSLLGDLADLRDPVGVATAVC